MRPLFIASLIVAGCARGGGGTVSLDSGVSSDARARSDGGVPSDGGSPSDSAMAGDGGPERSDAAPPRDSGAPPLDGGPTGPTAACLAALAATRSTFESGAGAWMHAPMDGVWGTWPFDPWTVGSPSNGPGTCGEGSSCFGTGLTQNYAQCGRADLRSPTLNLSACAGETVVLVWDQFFEFWTGSYGGSTWYDGGLVEISRDGGASWQAPSAATFPGTIRINPDRGASYSCLSADSFYVHGRPGFVGASGGWDTIEVSFGTLPLEGPFQIRFAWASGVSSPTTDAAESRRATAPGWFIDDVHFETR